MHSWRVTTNDVGPHVPGTGALFWPKITTREVFRELVKDSWWVRYDVLESILDFLRRKFIARPELCIHWFTIFSEAYTGHLNLRMSDSLFKAIYGKSDEEVADIWSKEDELTLLMFGLTLDSIAWAMSITCIVQSTFVNIGSFWCSTSTSGRSSCMTHSRCMSYRGILRSPCCLSHTRCYLELISCKYWQHPR